MIAPPRSSQQEHARAALAKIADLEACSEETLDRFAADGSFRIFKRGESVSSRGGRITTLCVIVNGSIEISMTTEGGRRHVLRYAEGGQLFNMIGILDDGAGIHDAVAHEETVALLIPKVSVLRALDRDPQLSRALLKLFCFRLRGLYDYIAEHTLLPLRARCVRLLLTLVESHGVEGPEGCIIMLKLSQEEFAEMLGRSRQSVNRELRSLENEGLIKTSYSQFVIPDLGRLQSLAGDQPF
ncbi:MAG: Crp/Fnr family transcriptional regulator [Rhodopseudomonas palustris]|uniref:Crp/Fnr family transcriptional regulator n=1 Tax=Rhodopseudomonas palustris TaxID=1076 RepID=A0A933S0B3_RHOPL|nr:Crp/Fnr family transcriptional regulator [Rhodopseudomonas palustris]